MPRFGSDFSRHFFLQALIPSHTFTPSNQKQRAFALLKQNNMDDGVSKRPRTIKILNQYTETANNEGDSLSNLYKIWALDFIDLHPHSQFGTEIATSRLESPYSV